MTRNRASRMICVVGAPRSGTTSLSTYLAEHPEVHFSRLKEPHFFSRLELGSGPAAREAIEKGYLDTFFPGWRDEPRILAEGSVSYLYAPERMAPILERWPDSRFVIAVRDPMTMLPSLHLRLLFNGDEAEPDFGRAWSLAAERREGRHIPRSCIDPRCLEYDRIASLGLSVERFVAAVGRERCFISVFDDLAADPDAVYRRMLDFLDLPYHPRADFSPVRASRGFRYGALQRLLKRPPVPARALLSGSTMRLRTGAAQPNGIARLLLGARKRLLDWNSVPARPAALPPELRQRISEVLGEDRDRLAALLGRRLDHWLASAPRPERGASPASLELRRYARMTGGISGPPLGSG